MVSVTAMTVFVFATYITEGGLGPWVSWDYIHDDWQRIDVFEKEIVPQTQRDRFLVTWYMVPFTSVIFFSFFGLGQEAREEYIKYVRFVKTRIFRIKPKEQPVLPVSANGEVNNANPAIVVPLATLEPLRTPISLSSEVKEVAYSMSVNDTSRPASAASCHDKESKIHVDSVP
ncbi:unnamed protein product [Rhizoctonia solani]|uniref:Uncharacterized protein n=1 Tax=Rhizoctonia solani TaxID=456999 RepID=A0A8H2XYM1_9AGAM|nr:unnamed protein product [Rhizoctonia solani]